MKLQIYTEDETVADSLSADPPVGIHITTMRLSTFSAEATGVWMVVVDIGSNVVAALIAAWLCKIVKGRRATIHYHRKEITCEHGEIVRVLEERLDAGEK